MKILHISDCHGFKHRIDGAGIITKFPIISEEFDIVVCSGDFYPNKTWGFNRKKDLFKEEIVYQNNWFLSNLKDFLKFIKNKPFFWTSGNHDATNPVSILNKNGIEAFDLDNKVIEYNGFSFAGFPYIPFIQNNWNFERNSNDMRQEIQKFIQKLKDLNKFNSLDFLVAHAPIANILDFDENRGHLGNSHMANALNYQFVNKPRAYFCGHVHSDGGKTELLDEMIVSNAATTWNIIEITS
jgi:Icc-related predicted phosphoesterase